MPRLSSNRPAATLALGATAAIGMVTAVAAQQAPVAAQPAPAATLVELPPVSVTATRGARPIDEVPATVSVIEEQQLQRQNANTIRDAMRYEPGVSVGNQPGRTGLTNFAIRGIGENRVKVLVDGIRIPDFPESNVGPGNFTRDFVDLESVRRIEIVRGPASALYGSDALGGVVAYTLKDPRDYLGANANTFISGRLGYSGADRSYTGTLTGAARAGNVETLLLYTHRNGHEVRPNGSLRANPQDYTVNNLLGRIIVRGEDEDMLRLTGEYFHRDGTTNLLTDRSTANSGSVLNSRADDTTWRGRLTAEYIREAPVGFIDRMEARLYWTQLHRREETTQERSSNATPVVNRLRYSDFRFDQRILGGEVQLGSNVTLGGIRHRLTYGATLEHISTTRPRDRFERNLTAGTTSTTVAGESYPNKNFPDTETLQFGAYLQDEFALGRLLVTPAVRFDYYRLRPQPDAAFLSSSGAGLASQVRGMDAVAVSPKLGAVYPLDDRFSIYGQYAHGFRAPPYDTANFGFTNPIFGYQILPATDLKPETSDGIEAGLRARFADGSNFQFAAFHNWYSNFISTRVVGNAGGLTQFQYGNLSSVTIYGAEARGTWQIAPQWALRGSASYARGEDTDTGKPLDGVDPLRFVGGIAWRHESGFGAEAIVTHALRNTRTSEATYFRAPSYTVLDLAVHYDLGNSLSINGGIFNVTNEKYFLTRDVTGLGATSASRDLYAQPGRYAAINMTLRF
jgi:hemoglobin/transferrin/lactoferrin receptor protein